jgi:hypothetical protein
MMTCRICTHPDRKAIDKAIVDGGSLRNIAKQFAIHSSSVNRHKSHIPKTLALAKQAETVAEAGTLLSRVERLAARMDSIAEKAENDEDWRGAAAAARELRGCLELLAKLNGELQPNGARVAINFGDITKIDIGALTRDQLDALYGRLQADTRSEIESMTGAEIDAAIADILFPPNPDLIQVRETIMFDDITVPTPLNIETNRSHEQLMSELRSANGGPAWEKNPWRNASPSDRFRMLGAAWKRETGEDLVESIEDLGARAVMEIDFNLVDDRDWMAWPKVTLKRMKRPVPALPGMIDHN